MKPTEESYYRVDFETAQLLKEAGFNLDVTAHYDPSIKHSEYQCGSTLGDWNVYDCFSAPLIEVAIEWLHEKGYNYMEKTEANGYMLWLKDEPLFTFEASKTNKREFNMSYIQACCKHIIEPNKAQ